MTVIYMNLVKSNKLSKPIIYFSSQALAVRRHQCENVDADPLVWTNQRFMRWAHNIDLGEFADNLKGNVRRFFL